MAYVDPTKRKKGFNPTSWVSDSIKQEEEDVKLGKTSTSTKKDTNKDQEAKKKQEEIKRKAKSKLAYNSLFERVGDMFEANSPQDKAKRKEAGQPELYQDQKKQYVDVTNRAKTANYSYDEIKARQDFFKNYGVNDLGKTATSSRKYAIAFDKEAPKGTDYKKLAEQAIKEGLFNDKAKATYEAAGQLKNPKVQQGLYRQAIREALPDFDTKQIGKAEQAYQNKLKLESGSEGSTVKTAIRGFAGGLASTIAELPSNAESLASQMLDIVSPEGSRVDKFAEERYKESARKNAVVKEKISSQTGKGKTDNSIVYNLGQGFGSLASSVTLGNILGQVDKVGKAATIAGKVKAFVNPFGVGGLFGINEAGDISREARDEGKGEAFALGAGVVSGYAEAILENWGLGKFLGAKGNIAKQVLRQGVIEGSQEFLQAITTYGVQDTYKSVDWSSAMSDSLQQGIYGAVIGGSSSIAMTMSNNLQEQGVPQDQADAIGMKLEQDIMSKTAANAENTVTGIPVVEDTGNVTPTSTVTDIPVGQAEDNGTVMHIPTMQIWAKLTPEQQAFFKDENNTIENKASKEIVHLSPVNDNTRTADHKEITLEEMALISPNAKAALDKYREYVKSLENNLPPMAQKPTNPPEDESTEAQNDWEDNYAQKYQDLNDQTTALQEQLKTAKKAEREAIQKQIDEISKQQADMEDEFIKKWKNQPGQTDEGVRLRGKVKPLKKPKSKKGSVKPLGKKKPPLEGEIVDGVPNKNDFDPSRLELSIYEPMTGGNPTNKFSVQVRYKGWAADEQFFATKEEAQKFKNNYEFKGLNKSVVGEYINMKQKYPDFPVNFKIEENGVSKNTSKKGEVKKIQPSKKAEVKLVYPEDTKELPKDMQKNLPIDNKEFNKTGKQKEKKISDLTQREIEKLLLQEVGWKKTDIQKLVKLVPGLKEKPILTIEETTGKDRYGSPVKGLYMTYDIDGQIGKIPLESIGIIRERLEAAGIKAGMTIDISSVLKGKGKVPVLRKGGQNYMEDTSNDMVSRSENNALTSKTPEQLAELAVQLNKAGQSLAILRKAGLRSKKALGMFVHPSNKKLTPGHIGLQDKVVQDSIKYVDVLAHELWHAIEFQVNGNTGNTYKVFGELTKEERKQIHEELKAITLELEGEEAVNARPEYFNKKTELMARYVEMMVLNPEVALEKAPLVSEKFKEAVVNHPEIQMLMDAIDGKLDKGWRDWAFGWYRDMRQTYQHVLGKQAGDLAYNAEVVQRARKQKWQQEVGELIKQKFKDVKDDQSLLFKAAESIKETDSEGNITFGTNDYTVTDKEDEIKKLQQNGWTYAGTTEQDGKVQGLFQRVRYTAEQARTIYDELSPEGKELIKDYTVNAREAKDFFNRNLLKEMFKVNGNIEGWVHRGLQDPKKVKQQKGRMSLGKRNLRHLTAGMMKKRGGSDTYLEDLQKQTTKALYEAGIAEIHNQYIYKQLARISKPIAKGQNPDDGWTEITADDVKGLMLPGEGGRDKVTYTKTDELTGMEEEVTFLKPQHRYQVPTPLVKYYRSVRKVHEDLNKTQKFLETFGQYWAVNVLVQGGTVGTNFISGGLQYSSKVVNDMFLDVLHGDATMKRTRDNVAAMVQVLMPHGWTNAPSYVYGGHRSNFAGQFITEDRSKKAISTYANYALMPFSGVETYWKKAIITSEGAKDFKPHFSPTELSTFTKAEEEMLVLMNSQADRYGFDYDNVAMWIESWQRGGGTLIKPFVKYPYKYMKFITGHVSRATDSTLPWQERTASLLTLATLVAMFWGLMDWRDRAKEVPEDIENNAYNTKGRIFIGKISGKDVFTRVSKYPFLNLTSVARNAVKGNWEESWNVLREQVGSLGPVATPVLIALGYTDQFNTYTPKSAMFGKAFVSAIPGFRLLNDIGNYIDNTPRKAENFVQGVFQSLPVWGNEQTKTMLRGEARTIRVPNEDEERQLGKSSTDTKPVEMYRTATLLSALTGIYTTRIDPEDAKKQKMREQRIDAEDKIYQLIREDKIDEAEQLAIDNGLWFTVKQVKSTQRAAKKKAEEE